MTLDQLIDRVTALKTKGISGDTQVLIDCPAGRDHKFEELDCEGPVTVDSVIYDDARAAVMVRM